MGNVYFTCSFDDGDICDLRLAELMARYNIAGTFYIPRSCDLVSQSLSGSQIRELSGSFEIGGHTISHQILTRISIDKASEEITECKSWLEDIIGKQIESFCPPTGRFNKEHITLQKKAGFSLMRTVEMLSCSMDTMSRKDNILILPTTLQVYNHTYGSYLKNLIKRLHLRNYPMLMKHFNPDWEVMSQNFLRYLTNVTKNGAEEHYFHLWGHSWEIERYSLWNSLERLFQNVSKANYFVFCNNSELGKIASASKTNER